MRKLGESRGGCRMNICVSLCINVELSVIEVCQFYSEMCQLYSEMFQTHLKAQNILLLNKWAEGIFNYLLNLNTTELYV